MNPVKGSSLVSKKQDHAPERAALLFRNLFEGGDPATSFELVAEGISTCSRNAERLMSDVKLLIEAGRSSSARFLLTTAREEIAKSFILADCCRLDLNKHSSVLKKLCGAFYDHIAKHAFLALVEFPDVNSMSQAAVIWEAEVRKWWPAGAESGEPDMPHDTVFDREFPLYVDYGDYDRRWLMPIDTDQTLYFTKMIGDPPLMRTEKLINSWLKAGSQGICSSQVLLLLNAIFKKHYIGADAIREELARLYKEIAERVVAETGIPPDVLLASPVAKWPLYHLVCNHS